ncbi:MAG: Asp-tRNA(Asn)/Glu-tRNA(Gln) amidotransferase subunit GatA [Patescibacteria group bacterium]
MKHLHNLTIKQVHNDLLDKKYTALELAQNCFKWIETEDKKIDAFLNLDKEAAYSQAEKTDLLIAQNKPIDMLAGVPMAIKDNILIEGQPATAGSKILENYKAVYDATVIKKLKSVGAVFLGKTNLDEFAMGSSTENSAFKKTKNPRDLSRVPGGSSGGSAAAVAANMAVAALGTDTGGSIRLPAAFCNIVGLCPTYGAVSRYGVIAMASSLDQVGPLTKTAEDAAWVFKAILGHDSYDATSASVDYGEELINPRLENIKKLTIGLPDEYFTGGLSEEVEKNINLAIEKLKGLGLKFKKISLPHTKYALSCYYIIVPAEVSANLARYDGIRYAAIPEIENSTKTLKEIYFKTRSRGFGPEAKRRIILGAFVLSSGYYDAYYTKAQKVRSLIKKDFDEAFKKVDVILTPVSPTGPFKIGEKIDDPMSLYLADIFTIPSKLAGLPAVSIPPGFQLIGRHWREQDILGIGQFFEKIA